MTNNPYIDFVHFIESDRAFYLTEKLREKMLGEIQALVDTIAAKTQGIEAVKAGVTSLKLKVHSYELDIKAKRARRIDLQSRLDTVSSPKEYTAFTKEIEDLEKTEASLEDDLFETWQSHEAAQTTYEKQYVAFNEWIKHEQSILEEKRGQVALLEADLKRIEKERAEIEHTVKPEFLQDYYQMKRSVPDPYVPVHGRHCSVCNYEISQNDLGLLKKHQFVACRECFRKLYSN